MMVYKQIRIYLMSNHINNRLNMPVDAGTRGVIFDKFYGIQDKPVGEGTHFKIPLVQVVHHSADSRYNCKL